MFRRVLNTIIMDITQINLHHYEAARSLLLAQTVLDERADAVPISENSAWIHE